VTLLFILFLGDPQAPPLIPTGVTFETREACSIYAASEYKGFWWRCTPVPARADEGDDLE
jgi:hypothetical protein